MNIQENVILAALKKARVDKRLTGEQVARQIGKSDNSFVSRVENGKIKLNIETINKLCKIYDLNPSALFVTSTKDVENYKQRGFLDNLEYRSESKIISETVKDEIKSLLPVLRKIGKIMKRLGESPITLADLFGQPAELLNSSSESEAKNLGRQVAINLRKYFNLGNAPIADIQHLTWHDLKIPICSLNLGNNCWGIYNKDSSGNPLIIYSSSSSSSPRNIFTIAHELGHHFFSTNEPAIDTDDNKVTLKERQADTFAQELLVPTLHLNQYMQEEGLLLIELKQQHIVKLCQYFKVSYSMMLKTLVNNNLIKKEKYNELSNCRLSALKSCGYMPEKYMADPLTLDVLLQNLVAKGIRTEKFDYLFGSELLGITIEEVKAII